MSEQVLSQPTHPEVLNTANEAVYLRLTRFEDAGELAALVDSNREFLQEYQPWALRYSSEGDHEALAGVMHKISNGEWLQYRIVEKEGDKMVGTVTFYDHDQEAGTANLGYWLSEDAQGKGYGFAGSSKLLEYGFQEWGLQSVGLQIAEGNGSSEKLAQKLGAVPAEELVFDKQEQRNYRTWTITGE